MGITQCILDTLCSAIIPGPLHHFLDVFHVIVGVNRKVIARTQRHKISGIINTYACEIKDVSSARCTRVTARNDVMIVASARSSVVNEEASFADEVVMIFVDGLRRIGEHRISCKTLFLRTSGEIRRRCRPSIVDEFGPHFHMTENSPV